MNPKINLEDPRYAHLHPIVISKDYEVYMDKTNKSYIEGAVLHLELHNWSVSKYKEYLKVWEIIKQSLSKAGYKAVYGVAPTIKEERLFRMFNLQHTGCVINGCNLMRKTLCQY